MATNSGHAPNLRHGGHARQPLAALPKSAEYLRKKASRFRVKLEKAVEAKHGSISVRHQMAIQSATMHFALSELWMRRLRVDFETMDHATQIEVSDRVSRELQRRDECVDRLGLDEPADAADTVLRALYGKGGK